MKGESRMKYQNCISLDVSKDSSHIQAFDAQLNKLSKVNIIQHTLQGFSDLRRLYNTLEDAIVVFEATGIYHRGLQKYLIDSSIHYVMINPLVSAKIRKQSLRSIKTDKKDCRTIAKAYYTADEKDTMIEPVVEFHFNQMKQLSRHYEDALGHLVKAKVSYNAKLDVVFPAYKNLFSNIYSDTATAVIMKYKHPDRIKTKEPESIKKHLLKVSCHREAYCERQAKKILAYVNNCCSGCNASDIDCDILLDLLGTVKMFELKCVQILQQLIELAKQTNYFEFICSIPGIGENLGSRIVAEIGDIRRFKGSKQLIAYAGTDPHIYQSGIREGTHLSISKKGNKNLRTILYLATSCHLRLKTKHTTVITEFYTKKKQQGKPHKVAQVASLNKLLKVIYSVSTNQTIFA